MRSFIIRFFILLGLLFPMLAPAAVDSYAGSYSGTYSGGDSGTWTVTVSSTGVMTGVSHSNLSGWNYTVSGQVSTNGSLTMTAGSTSSGATFTGLINLATGGISGTWNNSFYGENGTFSGASTASVASYAGSYSGIYSGGDSGTWAVTVSSTGMMAGSSHSNLSGSNFAVSGQASSNGSLTMSAGSVSSGATFTGSINLTTGGVSGTWNNSFYGASGTFSGAGTFSNISQTIGAISFLPTTLAVGGNTTASASATSGLAVSFSTSTPSVCTASGTNGSIIAGVTAGICTIAANQAGSANYRTATQVTQPITVGKASQTIGAISFAPTSLTVGGTTTASASATSGLAVSLSSTTPNICTVSGSTVAGVTAGTCTLAANQAGNASYSTATQVTQGLSVIAQAPTASLSPPGLNFTNQSVGITSAAQTVTLTNSGTATLSITGIAASSDFSQTNSCGASVAAGASCTLTITSTPTVAGVRTGTVTITSNAASSPSIISVISVPTGTLNFVAGWNLVGNSVNASLDVATALGDTTKVTTVWKWVPATSKWAFYAPSMTAPNLATYAAGKGYDVLTTINGGEGFWVNAKAAFTAQLPTGTAISTNNFADQSPPPNNLPPGWSLIAIGDSKTPKAFATAISTTTSVAGSVPTSLATLWAWDSGLASWYFYAPSLDNSGTLASYITSKGYLDFGTKTLDPTMGFWVNHP